MRLVAVLSAVALLGLSSIVHAGAAGAPPAGAWTKKNYSVKGNWSIVATAEGRFLELDERFGTRNAPDLKLFVSPLPAAELTSDNATVRSVLIAPLEKNKGAQRYRLPPDLDLAEFESLVVHCEAFSRLWGVADLHARSSR